MKIFKHRKRTQILGYRSPDWFKGHVVSTKTRGLTFKGKCGKVKMVTQKRKRGKNAKGGETK